MQCARFHYSHQEEVIGDQNQMELDFYLVAFLILFGHVQLNDDSLNISVFQHSLLYEGSELGFLRPLTLVFPQCYLVSQTIYPKLAQQIWHILKIVNRDIFVIVELNYNYKRIQCCRKNYPSFNSNLCSTTLLYFPKYVNHLSDFVWVDE